MYDLIVVGSGFCGSCIAYMAAQKGRKVLVLERRSHIAGNMYDELDESGILVHRYGPHIFHTKRKDVSDFLSRITDWEPFTLKCRAVIDNISTPTPFNYDTVDTFFSKDEAAEIKKHIELTYPGQDKATILEMLKCKDSIVRKYAEFLFEKDYRPYTSKQWGIAPEEIDPSVLKRVPVYFSYRDDYFDDDFQAMPVGGYTILFQKMLSDSNITVRLNDDALNHLRLESETKSVFFDGEKLDIPIVFTGAPDVILGKKYGQLPYRSLVFKYSTLETESFQDAPIVAYPQVSDYTRITEYTKLPIQKIKDKTSIAVEFSVQYDESGNLEPYYPIPTEETEEIYKKYRDDLQEYKNLYLCGRLADYKYYNMDDAISRAFEVYNIIYPGDVI